MTQEAYITKCRLRHGNFYSYELVVFTGVKNQVIIVCPLHGPFSQIAEKHFAYGCSSCAGNKRGTANQFIGRAELIHNFYYDYSLVIYTNSHTLVEIICPEHGIFEQSPKNHLKGKGCKKCSVGNTSKIEHEWLDSLGLPNDKCHRNVRVEVGDKKFVVDGCIPNSNIIFEFLGDFWHGNPAVFDLGNQNMIVKKTFGHLFEKTKEKIQFLRQHGYKVVSIWENTFIRKYKSNDRYARQNISDRRKSA